jgi:hypothetical protein
MQPSRESFCACSGASVSAGCGGRGQPGRRLQHRVHAAAAYCGHLRGRARRKRAWRAGSRRRWSSSGVCNSSTHLVNCSGLCLCLVLKPGLVPQTARSKTACSKTWISFCHCKLDRTNGALENEKAPFLLAEMCDSSLHGSRSSTFWHVNKHIVVKCACTVCGRSTTHYW